MVGGLAEAVAEGEQERARTQRLEKTFADQRAHAAEVTRQESQAESERNAALAKAIADGQFRPVPAAERGITPYLLP